MIIAIQLPNGSHKVAKQDTNGALFDSQGLPVKPVGEIQQATKAQEIDFLWECAEMGSNN